MSQCGFIREGRCWIVTLSVEERDLWVGLYVDPDKLRLHVCPLPMLHLCIQPSSQNKVMRSKLQTAVRRYRERRALGFAPRSYM